MIWQVIVNKGVTKQQLHQVLQKHGGFVQFLQPVPITRKQSVKEEQCIYSEGPPNLPELVKDEPLINAVIPDRKATLA